MKTWRTWSIGAALLALAWAAPASAGAGAGDGQARAAAERSVDALRAHSPAVRATWQARRATPALVTGLTAPTEGKTAEARSRDFLKGREALIGLFEGGLEVARTSKGRDRTVVFFAQRDTTTGLPVADRHLAVTLDAKGRVRRLANDLRPLKTVVGGDLDEAAAVAAALEVVAPEAEPSIETAARQIVVPTGEVGVVAWEVLVVRGPVDRVIARVDSRNGRVFGVRSAVLH